MSKYYYNGVLLPEIPADVLAEYPYAWIGKHEKKGQYQLFLSKYQWWYDVNKDTIRCANDTNLMNTKVIWYTIDVSTADTATEWIFYSDTDKTFSLNSRPVFWSSHNIKKNSEDSTEIYFYGSEPVDSNEPEEPDVFYKVNGNRLTKIANAIREKTGKPYSMTLEQMPTEIAGITGGGGGSSGDSRVKYVTFMNGDTELIKYPVIVGDTCHDPVTNNSIPAPTKEGTAQYAYEHNGWSLTDGGDASVSALTNVTEDRTVYAAFKATVREYTITYLDSDGVTVLKTEQLPYGTVPSYVPTSSSGIFQEWIPAPTAVAGNASYKAVWSAAIVVIPQITLTVKTNGTEGIGTLGSATEGFVWGAKYRLTVEGETSEWVATKYYTTFADGNKFTTSGIGNPWARALRGGSAVTAHRLNSHTGPMVSDTGEKFFVSISGPTSSGQYTATLYAKTAGTYTFSVVRVPD